MDTQQLATLIERKHDVLLQLHALAFRQLEVAHQGDLGQLVGLLAAKQKFLNELQATERQLDPFRQEDPELRRWPSPAHRERSRELSSRCDAILKQILRMEKESETELTHRRDVAEERLRGVHSAAQATHAYTSPTPARGAQLDVSSGL